MLNTVAKPVDQYQQHTDEQTTVISLMHMCQAFKRAKQIKRLTDIN